MNRYNVEIQFSLSAEQERLQSQLIKKTAENVRYHLSVIF
jgi:hypothetical protein